jgi:hypothetical protein
MPSAIERWYFTYKGIEWYSAPRSARRLSNSSGGPPRLSIDCFASVDATFFVGRAVRASFPSPSIGESGTPRRFASRGLGPPGNASGQCRLQRHTLHRHGDAFAAMQQARNLTKDPSVGVLDEAYQRSGYTGYLLKEAQILDLRRPVTSGAMPRSTAACTISTTLLERRSVRPGHERIARPLGNGRHLMSKERREHNDGPAAAARIQLRTGAQFQVPASIFIAVAQLHRHTELTCGSLPAAGVQMPSEAIA